METNVRYTLAGIFVLVMLSLIVFSVILLSTGFTFEKYSYYTVYMKESVSGLSIDRPVEFNGVEVGKIDDIIINKNKPQLVELRLKIKSKIPITVGTKAKLALRGALSGEAFILLEDKGTDKRPLLKKRHEPYPVIPTTPSIIVRLDKTLTQIGEGFHQLNESFSQISSSLRNFFSPDIANGIRRLLQKLGG